MSHLRFLSGRCLAAPLLLLSAATMAQSPGWPRAVDEGVLTTLRGGFEAGGLRLSFGLERATYVNGQAVATSSFTLPDVGRITPEQARQAATVLNTVQWVSNGQVRLGSDATAGGGATLIQNSLNDQALRQVTQLHVGANSLGPLKLLNSLGALNDVLTSPLRGR